MFLGANIGTVISLPVSGWLCSLELWHGWPLSFYLFGTLGCVWYVFWLLFVFDTPAKHPRIDPQERAYIESLVENNDSVSIILNKIFFNYLKILTKISLFINFFFAGQS